MKKRVQLGSNILTPLHRIILFVSDVQKCAEFYRKTFGFTPIPSDDDPAEWAALDAGGCQIAFHKAHGPNNLSDKSNRGAAKPHKIVFYSKNVQVARAKLIESGVHMGKLHEYKSLRFCDGKDPEGNVFQISNRK